MDVFDQLKQAIQDFGVCWSLLEAADRETRDIVAAVLERIEGDKAAHAERVESLTAQNMNQATPVILRDLAARELEQIKGHTFGPSEAEKAAFNSSMEGAQAALQEAAKIKIRLDGLFEAAKVELQTMKAGAYKNHSRDTLLYRGILERRWEEFNILSGDTNE